jgi:hypothetical protein
LWFFGFFKTEITTDSVFRILYLVSHVQILLLV